MKQEAIYIARGAHGLLKIGRAVVQWVKDEHIPAGKLMVMIQRLPQWFK